jgi:hypothetical protein
MRRFVILALVAIWLSNGIVIADILDAKSFSAQDFRIGTIVEQDSLSYTTIVAVGDFFANCTGNPGDPELPAISYLYSLPFGMEVEEVSVVDFDEMQLCQLPNQVHPIQEPWDPELGQPPFVPPGPIYSQAYPYPDEGGLSECIMPVSFMRGAGVATIRIWPIRYDPQNSRLLLVTDIAFKITLRPAATEPLYPARESAIRWEEDKAMLQAIVQNGADVEGNMPLVEIMDYEGPNIPADCVIITNNELQNAWIPYRDWMTRKGVSTEIALLDDIYSNFDGVDDPEKIRNFIKDRFINDGLGYVLLGGNVGIIPRRLASHDGSSLSMCDLYYAELDGNWDSNGDGIWGDPLNDDYDIGANVFVGRIPAENITDVNNWCTKRLRYETNPGNVNFSYLSNFLVSRADQPLDQNWWQDYIAQSVPNWFTVDIETLAERDRYGNINGNDEEPSAPSANDAVNALNGGVQFFEILNHGSTDLVVLRSRSYEGGYEPAWLLMANDLSSIEAGFDHITFSASCALGDLDFGQNPNATACFAQIDLVSPGGSIGGRYNSRTVALIREMPALDGWTLSFLLYSALNFGRAHFAAKLYFPDWQGLFEQFERRMILANNLLGCPEMPVWTEAPRQLTVTYPDYLHWFPPDPTVYCPRDFVDINVTEMQGGQPVAVPGALVTLWKDGEVYKRNFTDTEGNVTFRTRCFTAGNMLLTVAKRNFIPFQWQIPLEYGCPNDPDPPIERPGFGGGKRATLLPALVWNPYGLVSGDSLAAILDAAGFEVANTSDLAPYVDSLQSYHLFILAGIYGEDGNHELAVIDSFVPQLLSFLANGGSIYWEGAFALTEIDHDWGYQLEEYFLAVEYGGIYETYQYLRGAEGTIFENIDSIGYISRYWTGPVISGWRGHIGEVLHAPESYWGPPETSKAAICEVGATHTILTNFSWARLFDIGGDTRVALISDVMDWLSGAVSVEDDNKNIPTSFSLSQNYPNPFNASTTISYSLPQESAVTFDIFDISGRRVESMALGKQLAGPHSFKWEAQALSSGVYFYRVTAGRFSEIRKCLLIK